MPVDMEDQILDVHVDRDVMIPMRDGIHLAVDVYRPAREGQPLPGPFPVLVERTPYNKTGQSNRDRSVADPIPMTRPELAAKFVAAGYAVVVADCRGRFNSEGKFTKYVAEAPDGYDTLAWIVDQPWCNGDIGMFGLSYGAHTQMAAACLGAPGLKSLLLDCGGFANAYQGGIRRGGAFELKQATWAYRQALESRLAASDPQVMAALEAEDITAWFSAMPWKPGHSPVKWVPEYEEYLFDQWRRGIFDDYWRQVGLYAAGYYDVVSQYAVMSMCGWFDPYAQSTIDNYVGLVEAGAPSPKLIMGPWTHGERSVTFAGDVDFGPQATLDGNIAADYVSLRRQWHDIWLHGIGSPNEIPNVRYFRMGGGSGRKNAEGRLDHGGTWRSADRWPVPGSIPVPYYLHADGRLSTDTPAAGEAAISYDFDPRNPVPTIGGPLTSGLPVFDSGAYDQVETAKIFGARAPYLPLAARQDVLVFETAPLTRDVEVTGSLLAELFVASDAPDTDFTVKLIDVYPPNADYPCGYAMNVTDGILRCRYRNSWEHPEPLVPGEVASITVKAFAASNLFKAGHRIRIDISSSNFPHFDVNPNTYAPEGPSQHCRIAKNTVFVNAVRPSRVLLPIGSG